MAKAHRVRKSKRKAPVASAAAAEPSEEEEGVTNTTTNQSAPKRRKGTGKLKDDQEYQDDDNEHNNNTAATSMPSFLSDQIFTNLDLVDLIFSFLGVRELFHFTMTSKRHLECLTYDRIIKAAMLGGGRPKGSIECLIPLVQKRQIWIPSPLRVLRLVNGKICENCRDYSARAISKEFGVFFCSANCLCVGSSQTRGPNTMARLVARNSNRWGSFVRHERVAHLHNGYSSTFLFIKPMKDSNGNKYGPLVTKQHLEALMKKNPKCTSPKQKKALLNKMLRKLDKRDGPNADANAKAILEAYENWEREATKRIQKKMAEKQEKTDKKNEQRKQKTLAWIQDLQELVGDDVPWKDALTEYEFVGGKKEIVKFRCPFVDDILNVLAQAPSKATKKKVKELAEEIQTKFELIWSKQFHDYSFLSQPDPESPSSAFDEVLWVHLQARGGPRPHLGFTTELLVSLEGTDLRTVLCRHYETEMMNAAVEGIIQTVGIVENQISYGMMEGARFLALALWKSNCPRGRRKPSAVWQAYDIARKRFPKLYQKVVATRRFEAGSLCTAGKRVAVDAIIQTVGIDKNKVPGKWFANMRFLAEALWKSTCHPYWLDRLGMSRSLVVWQGYDIARKRFPKLYQKAVDTETLRTAHDLLTYVPSHHPLLPFMRGASESDDSSEESDDSSEETDDSSEE